MLKLRADVALVAVYSKMPLAQVFAFLHDVGLLRALLQVTILAKHLAVIWNCLSTFTPRHNVISVHLIKLIATIDEDGTLLALRRGTVTVTATAKNGVSAEYEVKIFSSFSKALHSLFKGFIK